MKQIHQSVNEPIKAYEPGSKERSDLQSKYDEMANQSIEIPLLIGGQEVKTGDTATMHPPHDHKHTLGTYHKATRENVEEAIEGSLKARQEWADLPWEQRAAVFLRAAELIAGPYRAKINAATMLAQSKTIFQAEIDSACELIDFL